MSIEARFYVQRQEFLLNAEFAVPDSGITGIFGVSGAGKTTLLRAIAGLDRHRDGYLKVGDTIWQDQHRFVAPHQRDLGYVFQQPGLFNHLTVQGNLDYARRRNPGLNKTNPSERHLAELLGIGALLTRRPATLSGGEQQRVAIARALAAGPRILLMDEPLASLDGRRRREFLPFLESLHDELKIPVLYVSHAHDEIARLADHLILIENGRVSATGGVQALLTRLDLSLSTDDAAESLIEAAVASYDDAYGLTCLDFSGGQIFVTQRLTTRGQSVRVRIAAKDVSLTLQRQSDTSILNIFPVEVVELAATDDAMLTVKLRVGKELLLARVTRKSAELLNLQPGKQVFAQAKSVAVLA